MKNWTRKSIALALTLTMLLGLLPMGALAAAPSVGSPAGEGQVDPNYIDPWSSTALPDLAAPADQNVDALKFTHDEWTGKTVGGVKNADVFAANREEAGSFSTSKVVYDSVDHAITGARDFKKEQSSYVQFLTGHDQEHADWSLVVLKNATLAAADDYKDFYQTNFTPSTPDWKTGLQLPASWTSYGFDYPIYTNTQAPWQEDDTDSSTVPLAPVNYNPVGLYRKSFTVSDGLKKTGGRVYLNFQGVESAYYVYVNGKEVGYAEDTYSPHSFDVTDYLVDGENLLAVEVHKFCDGTWFELQDMYKDGGIFRDVYLYSAPLVHIDDYFVTTDLDENYENATLNLELRVRNSSDALASGYKADVRLYDAEGAYFLNGFTIDVGDIAAAQAKTGSTAIVGHSTATASGSVDVKAPKLWSAETPNLYTMVISLYSADGVYMGSMSQQLGFREINFKSTELDAKGNKTTSESEYTPITINGKPLLFKGTNRHDTDPIYGKYIPHSVQEKDVQLMKEYNLNALRTSHYSNDDYIYYLCEKYGLYMMAETNLEAHQLMNDGDRQANFKKLSMDRTVTAFNRLKNNSAIVCWSTGNENHYSSDPNYADGMFSDMIRYFKENDPTRPIHSESSGDSCGTDMGSNMYPSVELIQGRAAREMPYVMCEYDHAMGNAVGNMKDYWDAVRSKDNMLGGFIWDWVDQARKRSLDKLGTSYSFTDAKGNNATALIKTGINDAPDAAALSGKSIVDSYALFEDTDGRYNAALSGSNKSFTLEVVCKPASTSGSQILFAKGDKQVAMKTAGTEFQFFVYDQSNGTWNTIQKALPNDWLDNWHQVVGVYDKGQMTVYIDGVQFLTGKKSNHIDDSGEKLSLGHQTDKGDNFKGEISLGRIYTRALTLDEINAQRSAAPAIHADDASVLLWAEFTDMTKLPSEFYDYYAEDFAHDGIYDNAGYFYTYGGDNGEVNHSGNFCMNGLVSPDRDVQPELLEVKYQYQSFWFTADDLQLLAGQVDVYNENSFLDLNEFELVWTLKEDENVLFSDTLAGASAAPREVRIEPGQPHTTVPLSIPYLEHLPTTTKDGAEYYLNLSVRLKSDTLWAKAGHEVAYEQFRLPANVAKVERTPSSEGVAVTGQDDSGATHITVTGTDFSFKMNKATGAIEDYIYQGVTLLEQGPVPNYWRGLVNNDNGNYTGDWRTLAKDERPADADGIAVGTDAGGLTTITVKLYFPNNEKMVQTIVYTIESNGVVTLKTDLDAQGVRNGDYMKRFLRIGTTMVLPAGFENVSWYGNGPVESMLDRKDFAIVDKYDNTVNSLFYPYMDAQDTGTMTDTKWVTVTNPNAAAAMAITAENPVEFSALHYTADDLSAAHVYEIKPREETYLSVNLMSQGTGNRSCGPDVRSDYCIWNDKAYSYSYIMIPYATQDADVTELTRAYRGVSSSTDGVAEEAAQELIAAMDPIVVTKGSQLSTLQAISDKYDLLPEAGKEIVGSARYEKLLSNIALATALKANPSAKVLARDQSQNGFDANMTAQANASLSSDAEQGGVLGGYFPVGGADHFSKLINGDNSFTIEATIRPNHYSDAGNDYNMIMGKGDHSMAFRVSGGSVYFFICNSKNEWKSLGEDAVSAHFTQETVKDWHHVAAIYDGQTDGGTITLYMDGAVIGTMGKVGVVKPSDYDLWVGYDPETQRTSLSDISTIRFYSAALTKEDIEKTDAEKLALDSVELWYDFSETEFVNSIGGKVSILGDAVYGQKLTAGLAELIPAAAGEGLTYAWTREDVETPAGTDKDYTIGADDIGKTITLTVNGSDPYTGALTAVTAVVEKAVQEPPAGLTASQETEDLNDGAIDNVTDAMEYRAEAAEEWEKITGTSITGLTPGKYQVRFAETETHKASNHVTLEVLAYVAPEKEPTPEAEFDAATMLLTELTAGMKYCVDDGQWVTVTDPDAEPEPERTAGPIDERDAESVDEPKTASSDGEIPESVDTQETAPESEHAERSDESKVKKLSVDLSDANLVSGSAIRVYQPGIRGVSSDSDEQIINLTQAAVPTTVGKTDETKERGDGALTGVTAGMEYKASGADSWTAIADSTVAGLAPGEYQVRVAGAGHVLASTPVTLTIAEYVPIPVTGVTLNKTELTLTEGDSVKLIASIVPGDADEQGVTWSSSDASVAAVDENGKVTALKIGAATITVTTKEGEFTAACALTVEEYVAPSSPSGGLNTTTTTEKNSDGSTTKTVTNKKTGAVTETTTYPDGTKVVATTPKDGETSIEVTVPKGKDSVTVTIPTPRKPAPGEVAVIVKSDGTREVIKSSIATEDGLRVTLAEGAKLEIVDNGKPFSDVSSDHWASDAVQFAVSRELFTGTGANAFAPADNMTRGMLMTVLARLDGQDTAKGDAWYSAGMEWAKESGISDGTAPETNVTRESLVVMLYRYAGVERADGMALSEFPDADKVSDWALDAMRWAVQSGILTGNGAGYLDPAGTASRAEVAAILQRFLSK